MKAIGIKWDTDSSDELENLPTVIDIPEKLFSSKVEEDVDIDEIVSDYITNVTGYCHNGFILTDDRPPALSTPPNLHGNKFLIDYSENKLDELIKSSLMAVTLVDGSEVEVPTYSETTMHDEITCARAQKQGDTLLKKSENDPIYTTVYILEYLRQCGISPSDLEVVFYVLNRIYLKLIEDTASMCAKFVMTELPDSTMVHDPATMDISFTGTRYISPQINQKAEQMLDQYNAFKNSLNFNSGFTDAYLNKSKIIHLNFNSENT